MSCQALPLTIVAWKIDFHPVSSGTVLTRVLPFGRLRFLFTLTLATLPAPTLFRLFFFGWSRFFAPLTLAVVVQLPRLFPL